MRPLPLNNNNNNKKQNSTKQQSILGFFDVPDSVNVAVQRKTANNKRKKANHSNNNSNDSANGKRTKNDIVPTTFSNSSSSIASNDKTSSVAPPSAAKVLLLADKTNNTKENPSVKTNKNEINDSSEKTDMLGIALDFPSALHVTPRNIVQQLHQRATVGLMARKKMVTQLSRTTKTTTHWSNASWLKLSCPQSGNALLDACILEWDPMGVLLAVMAPDDSLLRIYDWDTVSVTNAKGRNHRLRRKANPQGTHTGGSYRIETTLHTNVGLRGKLVRKLAWNPFDPDQIALLDSNFLYLFDLGREAARQQSGRGGAAKPTKVELPFRRRHITMNILFATADTMIISAGDEIACVSLRKSSRRQDGVIVPCLAWLFTWKNNPVSCIVPLDANRIVLGSQRGFLSIVAWKILATHAFASAAQPKVLYTWFSGKGVRHPGCPFMGICHLAIEKYPEEIINRRGPVFGDARATWVTSCGWAMATDIDLNESKPLGTSIVLHRTNPVVYLNHREEDVGIDRGWSLPSQELRMAGTQSFLCWERVPDVVQRLPDHDKFVLNDRPRQSTVPTPPSLRLLHRTTGQMHKVSLGKGKKTVTAVAMHTSQEWILVATKEDGVRFYNARAKILINGAI